jgi:CheY-like chemotaxis protein
VSLTGNLEDLPLLDILQIVSFSKKTGFLSIETPEGQGAIVFRDGFVVSCFTVDTPALAARAALASPTQRSALIRSQIEIALERLIRLHEGQFNFSLADETPRVVGKRDISGETLEVGINPQELVLDLARGIDEDRRNSSAAIEVAFSQPEEDSFEEDLSAGAPGQSLLTVLEETAAGTEIEPPQEPASLAPAPPLAAPGPAALRTVLLVDDEADVRGLLAERLTAGGYTVIEAEDPDSAVKQAQKLRSTGNAFLLVLDLGMPTSGGASFQGGFEVLKRLAKMHLRPATLLMTETPTASIQARARQMGINHLVFKPGLSKLDSEQFRADLVAFAERVIEAVLPRLTRSVPSPRTPSVRAPGLPPAVLADDEISRQFGLLQRHLEDLRQPSSANEISFLIMKAAREFFERGALFLVKNDELRGIGGFGRAPREEKLNLVVREVAVPLKEPSVFRDVVTSRKSFHGLPPDGRWEQYVLGKLGRFKSNGFALLPLLAHRETIAVLFGDNPETGREVGHIDALEVVVSQAGIAFENLFLQRKIEALQRG